MTHSTKIIAATLALTLGAGAAVAQDMDMSADTNGDGAFSYEELLTVHPDLSEQTFLAIDTDANGAISPEEMAAAMDSGLMPKSE